MSILLRRVSLPLALALIVTGCKDNKPATSTANACATASIAVTTIYPGASVLEVETQVVAPIEAALVTVPAVQHMHSIAREGRAETHVFVTGNPDASVRAIVGTLQELQALPEAAESPRVFPHPPATRTVLVAITGDATAAELLSIARPLRHRLLAARDVADVSLIPGGTPTLEIAVDVAAMRARGLTFEQIASAVRDTNIDLPTDARTIRTRVPAPDADAFANVVLDMHGLRVGDIATLRTMEPPLRAVVDGKPAVLLAVAGANEANVASAASTVARDVALPPGVAIAILPTVSATACAPAPVTRVATPGFNGALIAHATLPAGSDPRAAARVADAMAAAASECGASHIASTHGERLFPALPGHSAAGEAFAEVAVFVPAANADACARTWQPKLAAVPGVTVSLAMPNEVSVVLALAHADVDVLTEVTDRAAAAAGKQPDTRVLSLSPPGKPSVSVRLSPQGLQLGLTPMIVARAVRAHTDGIEVAQLTDGDGARTVVLRAVPAVESAEDIGRIVVRAPGGGDIPLAQVAEVSVSAAPASLHRMDARRTAFVELRVPATSVQRTRIWLRDALAPSLQRAHADLVVSVH